jgi:hypothetical protein
MSFYYRMQAIRDETDYHFETSTNVSSNDRTIRSELERIARTTFAELESSGEEVSWVLVKYYPRRTENRTVIKHKSKKA